jgi:hypothetical protein
LRLPTVVGSAQLKVALSSSPTSAEIGSRRDGVARVIIGMDPHKRSATIEIVNVGRRFSLRAGSAPTTATATGPCSRQGAGIRSGSGRWKAATASAGLRDASDADGIPAHEDSAELTLRLVNSPLVRRIPRDNRIFTWEDGRSSAGRRTTPLASPLATETKTPPRVTSRGCFPW